MAPDAEKEGDDPNPEVAFSRSASFPASCFQADGVPSTNRMEEHFGGEEMHMMVTIVSRWKGDGDCSALLKEEAPYLKRYGAISVRGDRCFAGSFAGEIVCSTTFADWATYAKTMDGLASDPDYMRIYREFAANFEMTDRALLVGDQY